MGHLTRAHGVRSMAAKSVLVTLRDRARVVTFSGGRIELLSQVKQRFVDVLRSNEDVYLQV